MRSMRSLGLMAIVGIAANCGGGGGGSADPGFLVLTLNTPNADDGAILFRVQGGPVDSVVIGQLGGVGSAGVQEGGYFIQSSFTRIVAAGNIVDGVVARVQVPDRNDAASYSVVVEQVAVRNTYVQRSLSGYSIAVTYP